jgi:hypothetical protein
MKLFLAAACLAALWALPMGKSVLATSADLVALVGSGFWLASILCQEHA